MLPTDQSTSASWWNGATAGPSDPDFFSATHGLVQTHPGAKAPLSTAPSGTFSFGGGGSGRLSAGVRDNPLPPVAPNSNVNSKSPFRHLDYTSSATAELRRNPLLSAPDECARACRENEPPRVCYYHFTLEYYTVLGA